MVVGTVLRIGRTIYQISRNLDRNLARANPGLRAIDKFAPPHLRGRARQLYRYGEASIVPISILANYLRNDAPDSPGNELQTPFTKRQRFTSRKPYQTRRRRTKRNDCRYPAKQYFN